MPVKCSQLSVPSSLPLLYNTDATGHDITNMKSIPGQKTPTLLQKIQFLLNPINSVEYAAKKYGDIFTIVTFSGKKLVVVNNPKDLQEVLTKDNGNEYEVPTNKAFKLLLGEYSIAFLEGDRHRIFFKSPDRKI